MAGLKVMSPGLAKGLMKPDWSRPTWVLFLLISVSAWPTQSAAQDLDWSGSLRWHQFLRVEDLPPLDFSSGRRDTELLLFRLESGADLSPWLRVEAQSLLEFISPGLGGVTQLATDRTRTYLPLDHDFTSSSSAELTLSMDRLFLELNLNRVRVVLGRQAITWGVAYFWPVLDLFAPFSPRRIDRDYKPGVDAARVTIPLGNYSEVEMIASVLGRSLQHDGTAGALARLYLGSVDLGLMGGHFHGDSLAGAFLVANLRGTGIRGEVSWTHSGDPEDRLLGRENFWRTTVGIDRQVTSELSITGEFSWNGFGSSNATDYAELVTADRILRGEINGLGQVYSGVAPIWRFHPLGVLSSSFLVNWQDRSLLWVPSLVWSTGNNSELVLGSQVGLGQGLTADAQFGSEFGSILTTVFLSFKAYF